MPSFVIFLRRHLLCAIYSISILVPYHPEHNWGFRNNEENRPLETGNWGSAIILWKTFDKLWASWLKSSLPAGAPQSEQQGMGQRTTYCSAEPVQSGAYSFHLDGDYFLANSKEMSKSFRATILVTLTSLWYRIQSSRWSSLPEDRWFRKWRGIKHHKLKSFSSISQVRSIKK